MSISGSRRQRFAEFSIMSTHEGNVTLARLITFLKGASLPMRSETKEDHRGIEKPGLFPDLSYRAQERREIFKAAGLSTSDADLFSLDINCSGVGRKSDVSEWEYTIDFPHDLEVKAQNFLDACDLAQYPAQSFALYSREIPVLQLEEHGFSVLNGQETVEIPFLFERCPTDYRKVVVTDNVELLEAAGLSQDAIGLVTGDNGRKLHSLFLETFASGNRPGASSFRFGEQGAANGCRIPLILPSDLEPLFSNNPSLLRTFERSLGELSGAISEHDINAVSVKEACAAAAEAFHAARRDIAEPDECVFKETLKMMSA